MIYLNYAATSYPKPECVIKAYNDSINALPSGQFRSAGIFDNSDLFSKTRNELGKLLGISKCERIYFSSGSTEGLNRIVFGLPYKASEYITTATEHNSVLRPLYNLTENEEPVIVPCDEDGVVDVEEFEKMINANTKAMVINHSSNVTGAIQDIEALAIIARKHNLFFVLDVSQSAGCIKVEADKWGVDALAFTGHKSIMGVQGSGGYYVREGISLKPLTYGGTGKDSTRIHYEDDYEYEVGTQNSNAIAALFAATEYVLNKSVEKIAQEESDKMDYLLSELDKIKGIKMYGRNAKNRGPVISINIEGISPSDAAYILQNSYGIITRAGLQCAPLIHKCMGTNKDGTLRISIGDNTTMEEIDSLIEALKEITGAIG